MADQGRAKYSQVQKSVSKHESQNCVSKFVPKMCPKKLSQKSIPKMFLKSVPKSVPKKCPRKSLPKNVKEKVFQKVSKLSKSTEKCSQVQPLWCLRCYCHLRRFIFPNSHIAKFIFLASGMIRDWLQLGPIWHLFSIRTLLHKPIGDQSLHCKVYKQSQIWLNFLLGLTI